MTKMQNCESRVAGGKVTGNKEQRNREPGAQGTGTDTSKDTRITRAAWEMCEEGGTGERGSNGIKIFLERKD